MRMSSGEEKPSSNQTENPSQVVVDRSETLDFNKDEPKKPPSLPKGKENSFSRKW
jgi:hypothetical protein